MKKMLHKIKENRIVIDFLIMFLIAFILIIPMLNKNTDIYFDDGSQHLMRAFGSYKSIIQNGTDTIISNFANGFGYSWNLFYGPLSEYFIMIMGIFFGSFNFGFKIAILLIMFASACMMYKLIFEITENHNTSLLSGIIYITSPYFFTDIYIRHAIGECMTFIFIPMVALGLYNLFNTEKNHYYLIFGACGLILSHNIGTVLTAIFSIIYSLINFKNLFNTRVKKGLLLDILFITLITIFFWAPFLETKFSTIYRCFEDEAMSTKESFLSHMINLKDLFLIQKNSVFVFEIGLPVIMMLIFSFMTYKRLEENKKEYLFCLFSGILSVWMATKYFPWKLLPNSFYIIQLPWRMLVFSTFFFAIIASINMSVVVRRFNVKDVIIISIICILYIFSKYEIIVYNNVENIEDAQILNISGHNNEWLPGMGRLEYLPSKAYNNSFYIATRENGIISLDEEFEIKNEMKIGNYMTAKIKTKENDVSLELPFIYYPGYLVRFDGIILKTYETDKGFLGCTLPRNEDGTLEINYLGTDILNISRFISGISFIIFIIYVYKKH